MNRIRELRRGRHMKQTHLCRELGVTQGALSGWETGRHAPDVAALIGIAAIFDVSVDYLLGLDAPMKSFQRIPVLKRIPANMPIEEIEADGFEVIGEGYLRTGHSYVGLRMIGGSMSPAYACGDIVIVRMQSAAEAGDDAVVFVGDHDAALRRISHTPRGITLRPLHPDAEPMFFLSEEIKALPIRILGVAVEIRRKLGREALTHGSP